MYCKPQHEVPVANNRRAIETCAIVRLASSGPMEKPVAIVVAPKFKARGMTWFRRGVSAVARLRLLRVTGTSGPGCNRTGAAWAPAMVKAQARVRPSVAVWECRPDVIDPSARVHPTVDLEKNVSLGQRTSIWSRAQIRRGARQRARDLVLTHAGADRRITEALATGVIPSAHGARTFP